MTMSRKFIMMVLIIISILGYGYFAFAVVIPGQTLDPVDDALCTGPTDVDCVITTGWQMNPGSSYVYNTTDSIGIGTSTPTAILDVAKTRSSLVAAENKSTTNFTTYVDPNQTVNGSEYYGMKSSLVYDRNSTGNDLTWTGAPGAEDLYLNTVGGVLSLDLQGTGDVRRSSGITGFNTISGTGAYNYATAGYFATLLSGAGAVTDAIGLAGNVYATAGAITNAYGLRFAVNGDPTNINTPDLITNGTGININVSNITTTGIGVVANVSSGTSLTGFRTSLAGANATDGTGVNVIIDDADEQIGLDISLTDASVIAYGTSATINNALSATAFNGVIDSFTSYGNAFYSDVNGPGTTGQASLISGEITNVGNGFGLFPIIQANDNAAVINIEADGSVGFPVPAVQATSLTGNAYGMRIVQTLGLYAGIQAPNVYGVYMGSGSLNGSSLEYGLYLADSEAENYFANGLRIGSDAAENKIDSGTNGAGTTTLYIGAYTIDTTAPSDERTKTNIVDTAYGIDTLNNIRVVDFLYDQSIIDDNHEQHTGVLAQQVLDIYPEVVQRRSDGYYMVDYKTFIPLIIKSVQDLKLEIDSINATANSTENTYTKGWMITWFGDVANGIQDMFVGTLRASQQICIDDVCISKGQLQTLLENGGITSNIPANSETQPEVTPDAPEPTDIGTPETPSSEPAPAPESSSETQPEVTPDAPEPTDTGTPETPSSEPVPEL